MVTTEQFRLVAIGLTSMNYTFVTPFSRAFYSETKHPF